MTTFDCQQVASDLPGPRFKGPVLHFARLTSTSDEARRRAAEGAAEGLMVLADTQTAGRGRRGRTWLDLGPRSLLVSLILRPELPASQWGLLVNATGVAVAEALRDFGCAAVTKWPNDVICGGRKVTGILLESCAPAYAILGLGINVLGLPDDLAPEVRHRATTVAAHTTRPVTRESLLVAILSRLEGLYSSLQQGRAEQIISRQQQLEATLGQPLTIETSQGTYTARGMRLAPCGGLVAGLADGTERVLTAGEVVKLRPGGTEGRS